MADGANNRSVIVYEPATQTISIKKIRDLGKFFGHSFSHPSVFCTLLELRISRSEPSHHPINTQIQIPCEDQNREFRAWPGTPHRCAGPKKTWFDGNCYARMWKTEAYLRDGHAWSSEISYSVGIAWFSRIILGISGWLFLAKAWDFHDYPRDADTIYGEEYSSW